MAWGVWNKIKKVFHKVGRAIDKGAKWVNDKVIKPFKPVIQPLLVQLQIHSFLVVVHLFLEQLIQFKML